MEGWTSQPWPAVTLDPFLVFDEPIELQCANTFGAAEYRKAQIEVFTAFFDASGTKRARVLTVAGFVSRASKWTRFEEEWKAILSPFGLTSFHMTDFVSSAGLYAQFKTDRPCESSFSTLSWPVSGGTSIKVLRLVSPSLITKA